MNGNIIIYHGSKTIINKPQYGVGNIKNDYGQGFYCTQSDILAKEWACPTRDDGYINKYQINFAGLKVLDLSNKKYNILNWLAILLENRTFDLSSPVATGARRYIIDNFKIDYKSYDVIIGYRADDAYFAFAQDFVNNTLSVSHLANAMYLGKLGLQVALISKKAFDIIEYLGNEFVDSKVYYLKRTTRDNEARQSYFSVRQKPFAKDELYISDLIKEGVKADDKRIQRIVFK